MYNSAVINYRIRWSEHLQGDLDAVYATEEAIGIYVDELFELLEESASLREALSRGTFQQIAKPRFDAAPVQAAVDDGFNIYYLKMWHEDGNLLPYRLIYAVHHHQACPMICILGLMPREDDYEQTSDFGKRVRSDYDHFGVGRIPRR